MGCVGLRAVRLSVFTIASTPCSRNWLIARPSISRKNVLGTITMMTTPDADLLHLSEPNVTTDAVLRDELTIVSIELLGIIAVWDTWKSLFRNPDEAERARRFSLLKSRTLLTEPFFAQLYDVYMRDTVVGLGRLFDNAKGIIGLKTVESHISRLSKTDQHKARVLLTEARSKYTILKPIRDQYIAHRDRSQTALGSSQPEVTLSSVDIDITLGLVTKFLDILNLHFHVPSDPWHSARSDLPLQLFVALDEAERWKRDVGYFPDKNITQK